MCSGIVSIFGGGLLLSWSNFCIFSLFVCLFIFVPSSVHLHLVIHLLFPEKSFGMCILLNLSTCNPLPLENYFLMLSAYSKLPPAYFLFSLFS